MPEEKNVTCPQCHGNGYVRDGGSATIVMDCGFCDSQGEVPKQSADDRRYLSRRALVRRMGMAL